MLRKKSFWIIITLVLIAAGAGGYYYYYNIYSAEQVTEEAPLQTAVARAGEIIISATGAGTLTAGTTIDIGFESSGILAETLVKAGDVVAAGDVLARLNSSDAEQAVAEAELSLAQAALDVDSETVATNIALAEVELTQAEINLTIAQADLDELLNWQPDENEVELAEANLSAAQGKLGEAASTDSMADASITSSRVSLERAQADLASAQEAVTTAFDPGREWELNYTDETRDKLENERDSALSRLTSAEQDLEIAQANYSLATAGLNYANTLSAQSSVVSAEITLEEAMTPPTAEEIATADLAVKQAEAALQQAELNLVTVQNNTQAEISYAQAQLKLETAQAALAETELVAPMNGTIMSVAAYPGESVSGSLITLSNLTQPLLEVYLDETDINMVNQGNPVDVVFDALPNETFTGQVVQIDPQLTTESNVTVVSALVQLDSSEAAQTQNLVVGLNATVEVIGGQTEDAVLVPIEALRELSPGEYAVFVMEDGEPTLRMVEVGLMDYTYAEITSGLEAGEEVTTGIVETSGA